MRLLSALIAVIALTSPALAVDPPTLTDADAIKFVQDQMEHCCSYDGPYQLGSFKVARLGFESNDPGTISQGTLESFYAMLERAGLITIVEDQSSANFRNGKSFSWRQMLNQTTGGEMMSVNIAPTRVGSSLVKNGKLFMPTGDYSDWKLVSNDPVQKGTHKLRILQYSFTHTLSQIYGSYIQASHELNPKSAPNEARRRGRMLIEYDVFTGKWNPRAFEDENLSQDFSGNLIQDTIDRLQ